jgi:hypothetical protein
VGDGHGVQVIGHPNVNANLAAGAAGTTFPETAPVQSARAMQQFNYFVAPDGPDAAAGAHILFGCSGPLPVSRPVEDGECLTIAGVRMQCFTRLGSDSDDCLTVYLPDSGVVLNNLPWPFLPNVYTLRGAKFRGPREWRDGLQQIAALRPEGLVNTHARAILGRDSVLAALEHVIDALDLILDQTLRGILRGLGLKADALQAMGRVTPAHTVRSWYMTQARALRGEVDVPRLQFASPRVLATSAPADTMGQYRVRIDPERSGAHRCAGAALLGSRSPPWLAGAARRRPARPRAGARRGQRDRSRHRRLAAFFHLPERAAAPPGLGTRVVRGSREQVVSFFERFRRHERTCLAG